MVHTGRFQLVSLLKVAAIQLACLPLFAWAEPNGNRTNEEISARNLQVAIETKDRVLQDYRRLLEVYYEYKQRSPAPRRFANPMYDPDLAAQLPPSAAKQFSQPFASSVPEFSNQLYDEFKTELDADPRLSGNAYRDFMRTYGGSGKDNDVLQRFSRFYSERLVVPDEQSLAEFTAKAGTALDGSAMYEGKKIFADVSKANGYPRNRQTDFLPRLRLFQGQLKELKKSWPVPSDSCSTSFKKLAKIGG